MAEAVENGVAEMDTSEQGPIVGSVKQQLSQADSQKQNGVTNHIDKEKPVVTHDQPGKIEIEAETYINGEKDDKERNPSDVNSDSAMDEAEDQEKSQDAPPDLDKTDKEEAADGNDGGNSQSGADMPKEDEDSNAASLSNSDIMEAKEDVSQDASLNPSVVSEDSSRDSVDTIESKSDDYSDSPRRDGLVSTVKDDEGGDILITLNEEDADKSGGDENKKDAKKDKSESVEKKEQENSDNKKKDSDTKEEKQIGKKEETKTNDMKQKEISPKPATDKTSKPLLTNMQQSVANAAGQVSNPALPTLGQTFIIQGGATIPVGTHLVQQGNQLGYLTRVGLQNVFVPVNNLSSSAVNVQSPVTQLSQSNTPNSDRSNSPDVKPDDLKPKSSLEMIELMKWEIQNRIPDNSNWSVAFHPKKEELSSITSFLLELGHDVVKEAVYKDIIQIQTKKKNSGELKPNEIESLDKMKTVYENTRKKVEHLQLDTKLCNGCEFKTESANVMNWHQDFPHYDPPWDHSHGWLKCAHCPYKTKAAAQFSFHMSAIHKAEAKLPDKISLYQCELCPLNTTTKAKLERHRLKCMKHFKLNVNLHPYYHDVNFCMKTCYYKPRKPVIPKPVVPPKPQMVNKPSIPLATRSLTSSLPQSAKIAAPVKPSSTSHVLPRPPPLQQMQPLPSRFQNPKTVSHPRPSIATARNSVPPAPRPAVPTQRPPIRPPGKDMTGFEVCELCGGYVKDRHALRIHFYYAHKVEMPAAIFNRPIRPLSCDVCPSKFWTTQGLSKHRSTMRHYNTPATIATSSPGTNQQCFMCMRKVVNLFIHIENVHGMTMKDLIAMKKCIICGNTSVDRKSLESHMASVHGVLIKATDFIAQEKPGKPLVPIQPNTQKPAAAKLAAGIPVGKNAKPSIKQNLCVFCQLMFADNIQLTMHCIKNHATCSACGMVVQSNKHLSNHNCKQMKRHCDICGMKNISPGKYIEHIKKLHMKPCKVTVTKMTEDDIDEVRDKIKREYKPAVISLDSEEDSDVELVDSDKADKKKSASDVENKENIEKPKDDNSEGQSDQRDDKSESEEIKIKQEKPDNEDEDKVSESDDKVEQDIPDIKDEDKDNNGDNASRKRKKSDSVDADEDEVSNKKVKTDDESSESENNVKEEKDQAAEDVKSEDNMEVEQESKADDNAV